MISFHMSWSAPEFPYRERDISWYWISIMVSAAMIAFAVWQKDFLFGVFIIFAEILAIVWANRRPRIVTFTLSEQELNIGNYKHYAIKNFESFSVNDDDDELTEIILNPKGRIQLPAIFVMPPTELPALRKNFATIMREVEYQPSFIDTLEKIIGF